MSLAAHAAQFGFLVFFENPRECSSDLTTTRNDLADYISDIERTYGQRKPLAVRSPIQPRASRKAAEDLLESAHVRKASSASASSFGEAPTPAATEGETATESEELITENETETEMVTPPRQLKKFKSHTLSSKSSKDSLSRPGSPKTREALSQHDLFHRYFRKDAVLLHNVDVFR